MVALLRKFSATFPRSGQLDSAAAFYYRAAVASYRQSSSKRSYQTYISAAQNYVKNCRACVGVSDAQFSLGQYYQRQDQPARAFTAFSRVNSDSNHYFVAAHSVANAHVTLLEAHERGAELPAGPSAASRLAQVRKRVNQYRATGQQNAAARPLQPNWAVLMGRYYMLGSKPDPAAALAAVKDFESRFPDNNVLKPELLRIRAVAYQGLNQPDQFVTQVNQLGDMAAGNKQAYNALQRLAENLYARLDGEQSARNLLNATAMAYQQLISVSTANSTYHVYLPGLYSHLGKVYRLSGQQVEAIKLYQQWLTADDESADALLAMAESYVEIKQWQQALQAWRRLTDGLQSGSEQWFNARYQTAVAHLQLKRSDRACTIATMVRVLHPDSQTEYGQKFADIESQNCAQTAIKSQGKTP